MRIAEIAPPWFAVPPTGYGGIEWVVSLLADGLANNGHDVTLYAPGGSTTTAKLVSPFAKPTGGEHIGETYFDVVHAAAAYLDANEFDVVHDHSGMIGPAIGSQCGTPVVHTLHGPFTDRAKHFYRMLSGRLHYVAISEAQRAFCPELSYLATIHNGIDMSKAPYREKKKDYVLFLGRINKEKGPELAVDAAKRAGRRLVMAVKMSEEFEKEYWRDIIEPRLTGDEEIIGEISVEEKGELLANAAGVLFPIQWPEPFGLVMAEAMACGTPVISFENGAAPEVIADGRTGFLVKTFDEFCDRIGRLEEIDPRTCRDHVQKKFSAEVMVNGYERAFEELLSST
ncbi:MAG: glycosyltransferase family 4 protein [Actinomycetota bacterium]|nr:glycosyltransferase family 4 protein [Actinomycetota bacterium]